MRRGWRKDEAGRPWRLSAKLLIVSSVATVIGFSAICANVMLDMRRGEETLARQMLENFRIRHRLRYQPQYRALRPVAARRRQ